MYGILGNPMGMGVLNGALGASYPAGKASPDTKALQVQANGWLTPNGYAALVADGVLGGKTCGAVRAAGLTVPSTCATFAAPTRGSYPWNTSSADTRALQSVLARRFSSVTVDGKLGPVTCGAAKAGGGFVPTTCRSFTMPPGPAQAPADAQALVAYASAVKAQNDQRAADLLAYAQALKTAQDAKNAADMIAYAKAVQAQNAKNAADMIAYAKAVQAAQSTNAPRPAAPAPRKPVRKPPVMRAAPPPPPPPPSPDPALEPANLSAEEPIAPTAQAGVSTTTKVVIVAGAAALLGYVVIFRKKSKKAVAA